MLHAARRRACIAARGWRAESYSVKPPFSSSSAAACALSALQRSSVAGREAARVLSSALCSAPRSPSSLAARALHAPPRPEAEPVRHSEPSAAPQGEQKGADAPRSSWVNSVLPVALRPYLRLARLDASAGTWLLLWPCCWSLALAAPPGVPPEPRLVALFAAGALLLRGAGCTVNDMWDADVDRRVTRTRHRPIASGAISQRSAALFLVAQLGAGLAVLLQLNPFSQLVGAASLGLVFSYPLMKRITDWPQAFLGLTINWGALLGWAAARGELEWAVVLPLYGAGVAWTLVYDTLYAHQDVVDDARLGMRSTALHFGERTQEWLTGFSAAMLCGLTAAGHAAGVGDAYFAGVAATGAHLAWQVSTVNLHSPADCLLKFKSNVHLGALVCASALAGKLTAAEALLAVTT